VAIDRRRRIGSVWCLSVAAVLALPSATSYASPTPSPKEVQKKLDTLNKQLEKTTEALNQTNINLAAAQKKLTAANQAVTNERTTYNSTRQVLVNIASAAYKNHSMGDVTSVLSAKDPTELLNNLSAFTAISKDRNSAIAQYLASAQRLQLDQVQAQTSENTIKTTLATQKAQKISIQKQIKEEDKLLKQLGGTGSDSSNGGSNNSGGSSGQTYNGPASGNARVALQYAYAQIGCPYQWGGVGPCKSGYDCSGLTMMAWQAAGVSLPHNAADQYNSTNHVSRSDLAAGDLIFMDSLNHVAIYAGGDTYVEAPHHGADVRTASLSAAISGGRIVGYGRP
jgi:cell wall-associated NlpC family hydrolase